MRVKNNIDSCFDEIQSEVENRINLLRLHLLFEELKAVKKVTNFLKIT